MFFVQITIAGAADFSAATPVVTFIEELAVSPMPSEWAPRVLGYSYSADGAAHNVSLVMAPSAGLAANFQIPLETPTDPLNNFVQWCGRDGLVIPRETGFVSSAQPPNPATDLVTFGTPWQLFFSTSGGKSDDGTFTCWYEIGPLR